MSLFLQKRPLTRMRVVLALSIAVAADAIQFALGPFGWGFADQVIDIVAMVVISSVIGFHLLFLPTFVAEFIPGIGMLPTWTGCLLLVLAQRWRQQEGVPPVVTSSPPPVPPSRPRSDVIDI